MVTARKKHNFGGFTLVELLVASMVTAIIFTAVATLAYALGRANDATDDMAVKQAQVRYASIRISELIRHCKLICDTPGDDLAVWRSDDNDDGQININELVLIEKGEDSNYLRLCIFPPSDTSPMSLSSIETLATGGYGITYVPLLPQCSNVNFQFDTAPPRSRFVSISFDLVENGIARQYEIRASLRGWAGNLLNEAGDAIVSDDD
ncbi:MAG: prepilin-type N-terminal cleavage/methylation domain-containing protein [Sedimentisphaerales bacterium]|nr:prepilin-type N-terminal cleavage/methylation domain-containing protein [Sedimentisphaerales bacterium]